jgi:hypothetical protein
MSLSEFHYLDADLGAIGHDVDSNDALKKIETTFDVLVLERGVFDAVRVVVGLLFAENEAGG